MSKLYAYIVTKNGAPDRAFYSDQDAYDYLWACQKSGTGDSWGLASYHERPGYLIGTYRDLKTLISTLRYRYQKWKIFRSGRSQQAAMRKALKMESK